MTHTAMGEIGELRAAMEGPVIAPATPASMRDGGCGTPRLIGVRR